MMSGSRLAWCVLVVIADDALAVKLQFNHSLSARTTLRLTEKLDLSGKDPSKGPSIPWACAIVGPKVGPLATIVILEEGRRTPD